MCALMVCGCHSHSISTSQIMQRAHPGMRLALVVGAILVEMKIAPSVVLPVRASGNSVTSYGKC